MPKDEEGLTPKQRRFVEEYTTDFNASAAAVRAGYSLKSARAIGLENLTKPRIRDALAKEMQRMSDATRISRDRVLEETAYLAFSNMADYVSWGPGGIELTPSSELTEAQTRAVIEVSEKRNIRHFGDDGHQETVTTSFKLANKQTSLSDLMKHLGMFTDITINLNQITVVDLIRMASNGNAPERGDGDNALEGGAAQILD